MTEVQRGGAPVPSLGFPARFSDVAIAVTKPPPRVGEDTERILADLAGLSSEEQSKLRARGIVA